VSADKIRAILEDLAQQMYTQAAEHHVKGMTLSAQYARVSQFGAICSDVEVAEFLRLLVEEGIVTMVDGKYVALEQGEPAARIDIRITSQGGNS
jgi:hypothetical protein